MAIRGRDYSGPGEAAMKCSAKTVMARNVVDHEELRRDVRAGVRGLVTSLPARLRSEVTDEMVQEALDAGELAEGDREGGRSVPMPGEPNQADVRALKERFEGMVFTEIDKERGELAIL